MEDGDHGTILIKTKTRHFVRIAIIVTLIKIQKYVLIMRTVIIVAIL